MTRGQVCIGAASWSPRQGHRLFQSRVGRVFETHRFFPDSMQCDSKTPARAAPQTFGVLRLDGALVCGGAAFFWRTSDCLMGRDSFDIDQPVPKAAPKFQSSVQPEHSQSGRLRCRPKLDSIATHFESEGVHAPYATLNWQAITKRLAAMPSACATINAGFPSAPTPMALGLNLATIVGEPLSPTSHPRGAALHLRDAAGWDRAAAAID